MIGTRLLFLGLLVTAPALAAAQSVPVNPTTTMPYGTLSQNSSGTVTSSGTYQTIWLQSNNTRGRAGCTVQNNSSGTMYVYFGNIAQATTPSSATLAPGATLFCNVGPIVLQDSVSITGPSGGHFYATQQ